MRQPENAFDPNAVAVHFGRLQLGFVRAQIAARIAPNIDAGERYRAEVRHITGGGTRSVGVNIYVTRERSQPVRALAAGARAQAADVQRALLGERPLRDAQRAVLERVRAGRNTLAVLGTGRGKSLCFQLPAATAALEHGAKTIVLYPLRALANDQYEALVRRLEPLGLRIFRANGAIDAAERAELMDVLETGAWDIVCTTPEFMHFHGDRFTHERSRPAMLVVDEAHHLIESTHRPAYGRIGELVRKLGGPQVLALTATAGDDVFAGIRRELAIDAWVIDPTIRENLTVVEARGVTNKVDYIRRNVDPEGKALVYCNSRNETMKVAEKLRAALGDTVGVLPCRRRLGGPAASRTILPRRDDPGDRRDVGVRRGHRPARRARRVSLSPQLRSHRVQPAIRARRARRRRGAHPPALRRARPQHQRLHPRARRAAAAHVAQHLSRRERHRDLRESSG